MTLLQESSTIELHGGLGISVESRHHKHDPFEFTVEVCTEHDDNPIFVAFAEIDSMRSISSEKRNAVCGLIDIMHDATERLGGVVYSIMQSSGEGVTFECDSFFPFASDEDSNSMLTTLKGTGMADLIQQSIAHWLRKRLGDATLVTHSKPKSDFRAPQLRRLGIVPNRMYYLDMYTCLIDQSILYQKQRRAMQRTMEMQS